MPANQNSTGGRILIDSVRQPVLQIFLEGGIFNDRHDQLLVVPEIPAQRLVLDPLDHLQVCASEFRAGKEQSGEYGGFRVSMDHGAGIALPVRAHEQGGALALLELLLRGREFQVVAFDVLDEDVIGLEALLLDCRRGDVDLVFVFQAYAAAWIFGQGLGSINRIFCCLPVPVTHPRL